MDDNHLSPNRTGFTVGKRGCETFAGSEAGWLREVPASLRGMVLARISRRKLETGVVVCRRGETEGGLFAVVSGSVGIRWPIGAGAEECLRQIAGPGFWFGRLVAPHMLTVVTRSPAQIAAIAPDHLAELPCAWPLAIAESWLRDASALAAPLIEAEPTDRVVLWLRHIHDRLRGAPIVATQSEIGAALGLSRNSVNRALRELEGCGVVRSGYRRITVLDPLRLQVPFDHGASAA